MIDSLSVVVIVANFALARAAISVSAESKMGSTVTLLLAGEEASNI